LEFWKGEGAMKMKTKLPINRIFFYHNEEDRGLPHFALALGVNGEILDVLQSPTSIELGWEVRNKWGVNLKECVTKLPPNADNPRFLSVYYEVLK
jgi:hypothetical protein